MRPFRIITLVVFFIFSFSVWAQQIDLELVESVPVETSLGISETSRTLPVWKKMIQQARRTLDIEIFYLSNESGEPLQDIVSEITAVAGRGVRVRIIVDKRMAGVYPETLEALNNYPNIEVRKISYFNESGGVQHAKYFIVDGAELFLGSQNFDWRALKHIHELGIRIREEKLARLFLQIFDADWQLAANQEGAAKLFDQTLPNTLLINRQNPLRYLWQGDSLLIYPTFSPHGLVFPALNSDEDELVRLINSARKEIDIQLLTYSPVKNKTYYATLDNALRAAALRGVKVNILVSNWNKRKPGVDFLKSLVVLPNVEIKFSNIPAYSGGFIPYARVEHNKYMIVDDEWTWLGTANWAKDYFYHSRNLGLVMKSKAINRIVKKIFYKSWNSQYAETVDPCTDYLPPRIAE